MSFTQLAKRLLSRERSSNVASKSPKNGDSVKFIPKKYQKECIKFGLSRPAAGFFLAPGLGKTAIVLHIFKILRKLGFVDKLFVVATRRIIYGVWRQEIAKWNLPYSTCILHGKEKNVDLERSEADVFLINYEGLPWLAPRGRKPTAAAKDFLTRIGRSMLVIDESSKLRNSTTLRFRSLKKILPYFKRRYILTGSPAPKGLLNLFSQIYILDMGASLGEYITHYRNKYFMPTGFKGYDWQPLPGADKEIFKRLRPLIRRYGKDQLNLPPITTIDRWVELPTKARRLYDEMEHEFVARWHDHDIVAANAAVATGKCRQIANGGLFYRDEYDDKKWKTIHDEKCADLLELLEELQGEPALVAFEFKHDLLRAQRYFKKEKSPFKDAPYIAGGTTDSEADRIQRLWNKGLVPLLWGHPVSVAHGLNLQGKGGIVVMFSMTWDVDNYEQFYQRVWRQGQEKRVLLYRILARDTVDEAMIANIELRDKSQQRILRALETRYGVQ